MPAYWHTNSEHQITTLSLKIELRVCGIKVRVLSMYRDFIHTVGGRHFFDKR